MGTAISVFILQSVLIVGLLVERAWRHRAEREAQEIREHLAHLSRVSSMGELAASLAHEINQPLTSILLNAQAASHLLSSQKLQTEELQSILQDIVEDDKRASEVIIRIRELASNRATERLPVNMNDVVQQTVKLVNRDLRRRQLSLEVELAPNLALVEGDRVQLQQVVLNLVLNAFEALSASKRTHGKIAIRTEMKDRAVHVVVSDNGPGIQQGLDRKVFEPFYTTKQSGMGMGLSIAKSIIVSHGGSIWANPHGVQGAQESDGGAEFHFSLPIVPAKIRKAAAGRPSV